MRSALLALALLLLLPTAAARAAAPTLSHSREGARLSAQVVGPLRTGVWRIRLVAPSGLHRIDFVVRAGDIAWSGLIRVAACEQDRWTVRRTIQLDAALAGRVRLQGCNAGVCWDTAQLRLPRAGNRTFGLTVQLTADGRYLLSGGVRLAREAFIFGPWIDTPPVGIRV